MLNALSVDVEDWFQVTNFEKVIDRDQWDLCESRVVPNVQRILDIFAARDVRATFFILGWIAQRHPQLVRAIHERGHEISTHGYSHVQIQEQSPEEFRDDVSRAIRILEDILGEKIIGYRAPSYSIVPTTMWAWEQLSALGIRYDSSVFPIKHDRYGVASLPRFPFTVELKDGRELVEFPLSSVRILGKNIPIAGGGYLRLYPYWFIKWAVGKINRQGHPVIFYLHPWEIDPYQPRQKVSLFKRLRHYTNIAATEAKIRALIDDFRFSTVREVLNM
jgi:polysaccharide deacetylase family protein (PEP-CTERM system associated)